MLRRVAIAAVLLVSARAYAQQDPELEHEDDGESASDDSDSTDDDADNSVARAAARAKPIPVPATAAVSASATPDDAMFYQPWWQPRFGARFRAGGGAVSGDTINPGAGPISMIDASVLVGAKRRRLDISLPLAFNHRQTYASSSLTELRGRGAARIAYRWSRQLHVALEAGLAGAWKPNWVDPFQPMEDTGELGTTSRYSHWDRRVAAIANVRPVRGHRVRVEYEYVLSMYQKDPNFDPIYAPLHLSPWDRDIHRVDAEWQLREHSGAWRVRAGAQGARWQYFFMFAGDAKTGITHAGPGGEPPNPLLELRVLKPRVAVDVDITNRWRVGARYELELMQDAFAGYLSFVGHHPEVVATWSSPHGDLAVRAELYFRRYGPNSYMYEMDPDHPELTFGDRRQERLGFVTTTAKRPITDYWSAFAEAKLGSRHTNYAYSIDWNYFNYLAWAGAEYLY